MIWHQETKNCKWRGPEDWNNHVKQFLCLQYGLQPEPGTSGLEKTAPPGELEFSSRSN